MAGTFSLGIGTEEGQFHIGYGTKPPTPAGEPKLLTTNTLLIVGGIVAAALLLYLVAQ